MTLEESEITEWTSIHSETDLDTLVEWLVIKRFENGWWIDDKLILECTNIALRMQREHLREREIIRQQAQLRFLKKSQNDLKELWKTQPDQYNKVLDDMEGVTIETRHGYETRQVIKRVNHNKKEPNFIIQTGKPVYLKPKKKKQKVIVNE